MPVPLTLAEHALLCCVVMVVGRHKTLTEVMVPDSPTFTVVLPDFVVSCVDVAVMVATPAEAGVKTPVLLILPMLVGLTAQVTEVPKTSEPETVAEQAAVWFVWMAPGEQVTETAVTIPVPLTVLPQPARTVNNAANGAINAKTTKTLKQAVPRIILFMLPLLRASDQKGARPNSRNNRIWHSGSWVAERAEH